MAHDAGVQARPSLAIAVLRQDPLLPGRCRRTARGAAAFPHGKYDIRIEDGEFSYADYAKALAEARPSIAAFKATQQAAFDATHALARDEARRGAG